MEDIQLEDIAGKLPVEMVDLGVWGSKNNEVHEIHEGKINELVVAINEFSEIDIGLDFKLDKDGYIGTAQDLEDEIDTKQNITDNGLNTVNKTIVGSINEIKLGKQDSLVSGTNIKTINGGSILGSGDLEIVSVEIVKQYNTLALALADITLINGDIFEVLGHYTKGDGGGFEAVKTSTSFNIINIRDGINPLQFGAKNNKTFDSTKFIQECLEYAVLNKVDIKSPKLEFLITSKLMIPPTTAFGRMIDIDFGGSTFWVNGKKTGAGEYSVFESAYYNGGILKSNIGTTLDSHMNFKTKLHNFHIEHTDPIYYQSYPAIRIQDWHQGTEIYDISGNNFYQFAYFNNNFYCRFDKIITYGIKKGDFTPRFVWDGAINLNNIKGLVAVDSDIGYYFKGSITGSVLDNMSFEGQTKCMYFEAEVYDLKITNSYFEAFSLIAYFESYVDNIDFDNNYINFAEHPEAYMFNCSPTVNLNILFRKNNTIINCSDVDDKFFQDKITTSNRMHKVTYEKNSNWITDTNLSDLLVNNTKLVEEINVQQVNRAGGFKPKTVNKYAEGVYSGQFTSGHSAKNGFKNMSSGTTLNLDTAIFFCWTQRIYVNIEINKGGTYEYIVGEVIGNKFYNLTSGYTLDSTISISVGNTIKSGCVRISKAGLSATITAVNGEIRLI